MTSYFGELKSNWRALLASAVGQGAGLSINSYILSVFAPYLLQAFGWSKAQYALIGTTIMATLFCMPIVGRLADVFGVRRVALVGIISTPLSYLAFSLFEGGIREFLAIMILQVMFGTATTATVYSRLVAERFTRARGLAFALVAAFPALIGAIGVPLLTHVIEKDGWRAGYRALAIYSVIAGILTLLLMPKSTNNNVARPITTQQRARTDYAALARNPTFWLIVADAFLCNLPQTLNSMQLNLMLLDNGASTTQASDMVSVFAIGVLVGRFLCGVALDRLPSHIVATAGMGLPALGMFIISSNIDSIPALSASALLLGLSTGAEGDIYAYLVVKHFGVRVYSSVLGLSTATLGIATATGSVILSATLARTGNYNLFVFWSGVITIVGSVFFLLLGRESVVARAEQQSARADVGSAVPAAGATLQQESA